MRELNSVDRDARGRWVRRPSVFELTRANAWAWWPWQRCSARLRKREARGADWGRCELRKVHLGPHALERGMHVVWFTES